MKHSLIPLRRAVTVLLTLTIFSSCRLHSIVETIPAPQTAISTKPVQMILDADFGSSTDDLFALMMLHHYIDSGRVELKGIIVDREGEKNAGVVDIFNTYYGHPDIPIALERNGVKNPRCFIPYNGICDLKDAQGQPLFQRTQDASRWNDGYKLYRQLLSQADDKSIVVVAIGFATTLAQLMESDADEYSPLRGDELFGRKVKAVYVQAGRFEASDSLCGYNMRAASRQAAIFYDRLPKDVELIMSPSNVGDGMDYAPKDVLVDLSATDLNPIKAVYTHYTCDTGQRMWDTNCVVNAVLGDTGYNLSLRGWVTFVDKGEESLMLFRADPSGNARYQLPGDSYFCQEKIMDIRRHNRMNHHPSPFTIEAPQPQLTGHSATLWAQERQAQLTDKYLGSGKETLDKNRVINLFRPVGYNGENAAEYEEAAKVMSDGLLEELTRRAVAQGKKQMVIITGLPSSGRTGEAKKIIDGAGLVVEPHTTDEATLRQIAAQAHQMGMEKVTLLSNKDNELIIQNL